MARTTSRVECPCRRSWTDCCLFLWGERLAHMYMGIPCRLMGWEYSQMLVALAGP